MLTCRVVDNFQIRPWNSTGFERIMGFLHVFTCWIRNSRINVNVDCNERRLSSLAWPELFEGFHYLLFQLASKNRSQCKRLPQRCSHSNESPWRQREGALKRKFQTSTFNREAWELTNCVWNIHNLVTRKINGSVCKLCGVVPRNTLLKSFANTWKHFLRFENLMIIKDAIVLIQNRQVCPNTLWLIQEAKGDDFR